MKTLVKEEYEKLPWYKKTFYQVAYHLHLLKKLIKRNPKSGLIRLHFGSF